MVDDTVADLIDNITKSWNLSLLGKLYQPPTVKDIVQIPIAKVDGTLDYNHSASGEYKVDQAYKMLQLDYNQSKGLCTNSCVDHQSLWKFFWKIKLPMKVLTFIWKLVHDSIPVLAILKGRSITNYSICPLCNEGEETTTHLFQQCTFARAVWYGSMLNIRTSEFSHMTTKQWIKDGISTNRVLGQNGMLFLRAFLTIFLASLEPQESGGSPRQNS